MSELEYDKHRFRKALFCLGLISLLFWSFVACFEFMFIQIGTPLWLMIMFFLIAFAFFIPIFYIVYEDIPMMYSIYKDCRFKYSVFEKWSLISKLNARIVRLYKSL